MDVERVRWPVLLEPPARRPQSCATLDPSAIEVREDGVPARVVTLERSRPRTLHAIVVDMSLSMREEVEDAREAARAYVRALPADEPAMILSFSEDPWLLVAPTTDRGALFRAIDELDIVHGTALWDALDATIRLIGPLPERKVIALVSDGDDGASLPTRTFESVLEQVVATRDLTVFPIALKMGASTDSGLRAPKNLLRRLALATGGTLLDANRGSAVGRALDQVREILDREAWIAYVPLAWGEGPRDDTAAGHRDRRVQIDAARGAECRIRSLGPPTRRAGAATRLVSRATVVERAAGERVRVRIESSASFGTLEPGELAFEPDGERATGVVPAVIRDNGRLLVPPSAGHAASTRVEFVGKPSLGHAPILAVFPPLSRVRSGLRTPEDVVGEMYDRGLIGPSARSGTGLLVEGGTFLDLREALGESIFEALPDYQAFAIDRFVQWRLPNVESALRDAGGDDPALRGRLVDALRASASDPSDGEAARALAAWIGDVSAWDVALALDRRALEATLRTPPGGDRDPGAERWLAARRAFVQSLPQATHTRVVVPMVPAFDPEHDVLGYWRILLPRPRGSRLHGDAPPQDAVLSEAIVTLRDAGVPLAGGELEAVTLSWPERSRAGTWEPSTYESRGSLRWRDQAGPVSLELRFQVEDDLPQPAFRFVCATSETARFASALASAGFDCDARLARNSE